ncbi:MULTISPECIES: 8-oxoguanine deaminase [Thalassolituus]|uniref:8-oxoguanine deaminase n=1 Tax=Thalassolituus TaxID=187492 RepID=UPI001E592FCA|nr:MULTISPECIES: 8-oxoguanine deaminase [Thalassolituus]MCB2388001.1 8-oxoguanine deaminase [Thalassolituus alkanivorans]MCB2424806.1 8-oxoguanine deaminase [Thalassolituus alkanivorans]
MNTLWIKHPRAVFTSNQLDASGGLVIADGRILEVLAAGQQPSGPVSQVFDASAHVVLPGLVNTHHHFYQTLTRACPPALNKRLFPWLQTLYPIWAGLTPAQHALATELAMVELLLSGCTTVADHHYLFPAGLENAIDIQAETSLKLGMRATLTRGSMSLSVDDGGLPPRSVVQTEQVILDDSKRLIEHWHRRDDQGLLEVALAPCSPFSVTPDIMRASAELAAQYDVGLHTHLAETEDENAFCLKMFGQRPLDYLDSVGWLNNRTWLAHGIHFNDEEVQRLGNAGTGICHCPSSNMVLASGICRVNELRAAGSPVGLGVDGSASNDHSNLMQEVRQALLIQRLRYQADEFTHLDALHLATKGSAQVLRRDDIGELAPGKRADIAFFKLDEPRFSGAHDPLAALVLCGASQADAVMINGDWKVRDKQWLGGDIRQLMANHQQAASQLFSGH